ncbi:MAG: LysM domain-containing protein, partial [Erythrobacter sp.]|uniref:LysM peptidoglycan-binding domain-containing protein n=1 Tax=Erythrobacter sp. TaxID=1042 RepID=UPI00329A6DB2
GSAYIDASGFEQLNSYDQGSRSGTYTVRGGESLQQIAASTYGDANLWYKIAQANGLSGSEALSAGRTLRMPAGVVKSTHSASTFKPYNPGEAVGELSPTSPKPSKGAKCGVFGQVLVAVVAIAVSVALPGGGTLIGGAINAAIGSVASQAVGVATGIQEKFSFKSVALAAISGGVSGGLTEVGAFGTVGQAAEGAKKVFAKGAIGIKSGIVDAAVKGAVSSAITQGIGVATGLQDKFSFAGVAAAGVAAGVGYGIGGKMDGLSGDGSDRSFGNIAAHTAVGAARLFASAATRSAIEGSSFGKAIEAGLPDVIGQVIGGAIGGRIAGALERAKPPTRAEIMIAGAHPLLAAAGVPVAVASSPGGKVRIETAEGKTGDQLRGFGNEWERHEGSSDYPDGFAEQQQTKWYGLADVADAQPDGRYPGVQAVAVVSREASVSPELISEPSLLDTAIDLGGRALDFALEAPVIMGMHSINDVRDDLRTISSGLTYGINFIEQQYNSGRDFVDQSAVGGYVSPVLFSTDFGVSTLSTLGRGVAGIPGALADPDDAISAFGWGVVRTIDSVLVAENTPAKVHISKGIDDLRNSSSREIATAGGRLTGEGLLLVSPAKAVGLSRASSFGSRPRIVSEPHKNSLGYVGETHVYVIKRADGTVVKIGESAQGTRVRDGASIRAEQQRRALERETGIAHETQIRQVFTNKREARAYETRFIETFRRIYGQNALPLNKTNR